MSNFDKFLPPQGDLKFVAEQEPWSVYRFENGSVYRIRPTLVFAKDHGLFGTDHPMGGLPSYSLQINQMQHMEWTEDVIQAAKEFRRKHGLPELVEGSF